MQKHISINDRPVIDKMLRAGYKQKNIVLALGFTKGTISKEIILKKSSRENPERWRSLTAQNRKRTLGKTSARTMF